MFTAEVILNAMEEVEHDWQHASGQSYCAVMDSFRELRELLGLEAEKDRSN